MVRLPFNRKLKGIFIARVCAASLLAVFISLLIVRANLSSQSKKLEARWSQSLAQPTLAKREALKRDLIQQGCQVIPQGTSSRVVFEGSHEKCVALVNRLLAEPYAWESWMGEKVSPGQVKTNIVVTSL